MYLKELIIDEIEKNSFNNYSNYSTISIFILVMLPTSAISGANPISGQVSVGAKGIWIENGNLSYPVKEVTIATDILSFCRSIKKVGNDLRFIPVGGYVGSPSLLVRNVTVSGK